MLTAALLTVLVVAFVAGLILMLRRSAKTGLPPPDVLERAERRAATLKREEDAED